MGITHGAASQRKQLEEQPHKTRSTTGVLNMPLKWTCYGCVFLALTVPLHQPQNCP